MLRYAGILLCCLSLVGQQTPPQQGLGNPTAPPVVSSSPAPTQPVAASTASGDRLGQPPQATAPPVGKEKSQPIVPSPESSHIETPKEYFRPDRRVDSRLKDVARLQGVRGNQLIGYGIVVGLDGSGDKDQTKFTTQTLTNLMARQGISVDPKSVKVKNVAAVMVTAELPAFAKPGGRIDVTVSSTGDAKSLAGGNLLLTPLTGADGQVYAVAQGALLVGGFGAKQGGGSGPKVHLTVGRIPEGALVEREIPNTFNTRANLRYSLLETDFTGAVRVAHAINEELGEAVARPADAGTIELQIPKAYQGRVVELVARLENMPIQVQPKARVVVNERTGTVIFGSEVKIGAVSIMQGPISIIVSAQQGLGPDPKAAPASNGKEKTNSKTELPKLLALEPGVSVGKIVNLLNQLGVAPQDLVSILQAIKEAGALQAELKII